MLLYQITHHPHMRCGVRIKRLIARTKHAVWRLLPSVRADISRISIELFDATLQKWCGSENPQPRCDCQACDWHRLCPHARQETPDSVLCAGYQAFYSYSAPHMRVMRDLIKQHRSPMELMTMLR